MKDEEARTELHARVSQELPPGYGCEVTVGKGTKEEPWLSCVITEEDGGAQQRFDVNMLPGDRSVPRLLLTASSIVASVVSGIHKQPTA